MPWRTPPTPTKRAQLAQLRYEHVIARAQADRRREFDRAIDEGLGLDDLAEAVSLEVEDVEAIVAGLH